MLPPVRKVIMMGCCVVLEGSCCVFPLPGTENVFFFCMEYQTAWTSFHPVNDIPEYDPGCRMQNAGSQEWVTKLSDSTDVKTQYVKTQQQDTDNRL